MGVGEMVGSPGVAEDEIALVPALEVVFFELFRHCFSHGTGKSNLADSSFQRAACGVDERTLS